MNTQELLLCGVFCYTLDWARVIFHIGFVDALPSSYFSSSSCHFLTRRVHLSQLFFSLLRFSFFFQSWVWNPKNPWHSLCVDCSFVLQRAENETNTRENYEEQSHNINMCEHEQNFHALDVVFFSFSRSYRDVYLCFLNNSSSLSLLLLLVSQMFLEDKAHKDLCKAVALLVGWVGRDALKDIWSYFEWIFRECFCTNRGAGQVS